MGVRAKEPGLEAPVGGDRCSRIECGTLGATGAAAAAWATGLAGRRSRLLAYRITCAGGRVIGAKPRSTRRTPSTPTSPFERLNWGFTGFEKSVAGEGYAATCLHHWRTWHVPATGGTVHGSSRQPHRPERKRRKASGRAAERAHQASSSTRRRQSSLPGSKEAGDDETHKKRKRTPPPLPWRAQSTRRRAASSYATRHRRSWQQTEAAAKVGPTAANRQRLPRVLSHNRL